MIAEKRSTQKVNKYKFIDSPTMTVLHSYADFFLAWNLASFLVFQRSTSSIADRYCQFWSIAHAAWEIATVFEGWWEVGSRYIASAAFVSTGLYIGEKFYVAILPSPFLNAFVFAPTPWCGLLLL